MCSMATVLGCGHGMSLCSNNTNHEPIITHRKSDKHVVVDELKRPVVGPFTKDPSHTRLALLHYVLRSKQVCCWDTSGDSGMQVVHSPTTTLSLHCLRILRSNVNEGVHRATTSHGVFLTSSTNGATANAPRHKNMCVHSGSSRSLPLI